MTNVYDTEVRHRMVAATAWLPSRAAEPVNDHIWMSRSNSYPYLVTADDGDLLVNTGHRYQGPRHRERFEAAIGRPLDLRAIVFTQSHPDHIGGLHAFAGDGVETIAQRRLPITLAERRSVAAYVHSRPTDPLFARRRVAGEPAEEGTKDKWNQPPQEVSTCVDDRLAFVVGGRRYEALAVPGGESLDGLALWLAEERTVWIGNLMGALWGALPHLSTIRGDRPRSAMLFVRSVERVLALEPELLLTGHDEPIRGAERIQVEVGKVVDAVRFIHDETLAGMRAGKSLWELMEEVRLPPELEPASGRGPVSWAVRAVWEEHVGWFRAESLTELFPVPQRAVWPELVELAGGAATLVDRARTHLAAGEPLEALHLLDLVGGVAPDDAGARAVRIAVLEELRRREGDDHYDLARLLELELGRERQAARP